MSTQAEFEARAADDLIKHQRSRIAELEHALLKAADWLEEAYGSLMPYKPPGPPTSLAGAMRAVARGEHSPILNPPKPVTD